MAPVRRLIRSLLGFALATALVSTAHAQDVGSGAHAMPTGEARITPRWDNFLFTGNHTDTLGVGTADTGGTEWASLFSAQADFRTFVINLAIPLAFGHSWATTTVGGASRTTNDDQAELGNIELEGYANVDIGSEHRLLIGGGLALPTATDQLNFPTTGSLGTPVSLRGIPVRQGAWHTSFRNAAAWADQAFTIWPTASYRYATDWLLVRASGSIPFFLPTRGTYGAAVLGAPLAFSPGETTVARGNVEVMFELDVSGAVRLGNIVDVGASFLGWALPSAAGMMGNPDLGQTAVSLFAQTDEALDFPLGAGFEWIIDLDNAWGPSGGDRRFWGAHAYIYGRIDIGEHGAVSTPDFHPEGAERVHVGPSEGGASTETGATTTTP